MLKNLRNSLIATSIFYVILGVVLLIFPDYSLHVSSSLIGAAGLLYGGFRIFSYFRKSDGSYSERLDLFFGLLLVVAGVFLILSPQVIITWVPIAMGIYVLVDSFTAIKKGFQMKSVGFAKWWILALVALVLAACGVLMIVNPFGALTTLAIFIGVSFIFDGVFTLTNTIIAQRVLGVIPAAPASEPKE